jgi:hypothetical protein
MDKPLSMTQPPGGRFLSNQEMRDCRFQAAVAKAIQEEAVKIVEEEAMEAGKRAEARVKEMALKVAARMASRVEYNPFGDNQMEVKLTIDFNER